MRHAITTSMLYFHCTTGLKYILNFLSLFLLLHSYWICTVLTISMSTFYFSLFSVLLKAYSLNLFRSFQLSWSHSLQDLRFLLFHVINLGLKSQDLIQRLNSLPALGLKLNSQYLTRFALTFPAHKVYGVPYWYKQTTKNDMKQVDVNGPNTAPVYQFLKSSAGGFLGDLVKWNFEKFLVDKNGKVVERYPPTTSPIQIEVLILLRCLLYI